MKDNGHISVMKDEVLDYLGLRYPGRFLDMTFGGGGHTRAILEGNKENEVVAVDCDPDAVARAEEIKKGYPTRFKFVDSFFNELSDLGKFDGILFDLGVSSFQLDTPNRGFSFRADAEADMRMNPRKGVPAWKFIEEADTGTLEKIVRDYAEEKHWRAIVKDLEAAKGTPKLRTTLGLAEIISNHAQGGRHINPATRVFMGLRMAVNREIERLEGALPWAFDSLSLEGILAVISFHSIEDRAVKLFFRNVTRPKDSAPAKLLIKKVGRPTKGETKENVRARSAKLRVLQKISPKTFNTSSAKHYDQTH